MSKKKNHYVPQFYLRFFASDRSSTDAPKRINLYNLMRKIFVQDVSIKDQCYKQKFYGNTEEVEDILMTLEGEYARILLAIIKREKLPASGSEDDNFLLGFISVQLLRTVSAASHLNQHIDKVMKSVLEDHQSELGINLNGVTIGIKNPAIILLNFIMDYIFALNDLKLQLVYSGRYRKFITSDNPVVKYNQYIQSIQAPGKTGVTKRGLQIYLPISPNLLLILYDKNIYRIPSDQDIIREISDRDISVLNLFQLISADENIYFSDWGQKDSIQSLIHTSERYRKEKRVVSNKFVENGKENKSQLVIVYDNIPNVRLDLSFMKIKRSARKIPIRNRIKEYRKEFPDEFE